MGLKMEPTWRRLCTARLSGDSELSRPPMTAMSAPVALSMMTHAAWMYLGCMRAACSGVAAASAA